jgi:hypothetical protein
MRSRIPAWADQPHATVYPLMNRLLRSLPFAAYLTMCPHLWVVDAMAAQHDALLATGLDISASINAEELKIQVEGMALALESPAFVQAATSGPNHSIGVSIYLWSDGLPVQILPWTPIASQQDAENAADNLRRSVSGGVPKLGSLTDVSGALEFGLAIIKAAGGHESADKLVLNLITNAGDDNVSPTDARPARDALVAYGVTINGVAMPCPCDVQTYLRANVTNGFVLSVTTPESFPSVITAKFRMDLAQR